MECIAHEAAQTSETGLPTRLGLAQCWLDVREVRPQEAGTMTERHPMSDRLKRAVEAGREAREQLGHAALCDEHVWRDSEAGCTCFLAERQDHAFTLAAAAVLLEPTPNTADVCYDYDNVVLQARRAELQHEVG